jgi:hypothetical protein
MVVREDTEATVGTTKAVQVKSLEGCREEERGFPSGEMVQRQR